MKKTGFTLIEVVVSVAIVGILSSIVLTSLATSRAKGRDAKRLDDITQIQRALALYYEVNQQYPTSAGGSWPNNRWTTSNHSASWTALQTALSPYLPSLPHDPKEDGSGWPGTVAPLPNRYAYAYYSDPAGSDGCALQQYILIFKPEASVIKSPGLLFCNGGQVYNQNANGAVTVGSGPR